MIATLNCITTYIPTFSQKYTIHTYTYHNIIVGIVDKVYIFDNFKIPVVH